MKEYEVDGRPVVLHGIYQHSEILPPSLLVGGHGGGVVAYAYAVVEYEDGEFEYVKPIRLKGKIYNVGSDEKWKNY